MNEWKKAGLVLLVSAAVLGFAGANGRSEAWAMPEGEQSGKAIQAAVQQPSENLASADADADNGPGCAEASLSH